MEVDNNLIGQVVKALGNQNRGSNELTKFYGTVETVDGRKCVKIDGSDAYTAVVEGTEVMDGDRVLVGIENHQAVVYANVTSPASARTATNFMDFSADEGGLVVGNLINDGNEFNVLIKSNGLYIRNGYGNSAIILAVYDGNGVSLCDEEGNPVAKFYENGIIFNPDDSNCETRINNGGLLMKYKDGNSYRYHKLNANGFWLNNPNDIYNHPIGYIANADCNSESYILQSQTWRNNVGRLSLPYGTWLITFGGSFSAEEGGTRQFVLNTDGGNEPSQTRQDIVISPAGEHAVRAINSRIVTVSSSTLYYLHAYSGATSSTTVYPFLRAVRIA